MTSVKVTPLEAFVKAYLKKNKRLRSVTAFNYLRRASVYIGEKIESTCCDDGEAVINLFSKGDNEFSNAVKAFLANMPLKGNLKSLRRAKDAIDDFIAPECCILSKMAYTFTPSDDETVTSDGATEETTTVTLRVQIAGPFLSEILKIEFYVDDVLTTTTTDIADFDDITFESDAITVPISDSVDVDVKAVITYKGGTVKESAVFTITLTDDFV